MRFCGCLDVLGCVPLSRPTRCADAGSRWLTSKVSLLQAARRSCPGPSRKNSCLGEATETTQPGARCCMGYSDLLYIQYRHWTNCRYCLRRKLWPPLFIVGWIPTRTLRSSPYSAVNRFCTAPLDNSAEAKACASAPILKLQCPPACLFVLTCRSSGGPGRLCEMIGGRISASFCPQGSFSVTSLG